MGFGLRQVLHLAGKSDEKVAAVFGFEAHACRRAVLYLRAGADGVPVWLFSTVPLPPETAALCDRVYVHGSPLKLLLLSQRVLWPRWVAICCGTWTGEPGKWPLKVAPFLIPPFRALLLNNHGDFLPGTPATVVVHGYRRVRDAVHPVTAVVHGYRWVRDAVHYGLTVLSQIGTWEPVTRARHVLSAISLGMIAEALRWCGLPQRALFDRLHGREALEIAVDGAPPAGGIARYSQNGGPWHPRAFETLVRFSDARWVLWQIGDAEVAVNDMLPLFEDSRTFAVSRQSHVRGWKSMLFPLAPFRALQAGEATAVLAPLSDAILVDRCKLTALGIPDAGLATTAWMLLFWKAAAAGWRSYSMGLDNGLAQNLPVQPDYPVPETAFALRVLARRSWQRLGPREPHLSRGAIAFMPLARPPATRGPGRLKALVVSPFLPYPLSHGGAVRIYNLCRALSGRVDFALMAIREAREAVDYRKLHEVFSRVYIADIDQKAGPDAQLPKQVRGHQSLALRAAIADLCREWRPDLLQIEYTHMAAFRDSAPGVPAILVEHDLTFSLYRQLADAQPSAAARREFACWLAFERRWLSAYDAVWTVSEDDRQSAIREGAPADRTFSVPNGVDIARFVPGEQPTTAPEVFFVGSFRHLPNVIGFEKLCAEIMPLVWDRSPNVVLRVVAGPDHERYWRTKAADSRILVHGFVEDLRPLYARATVVVVPLDVSAGTNIKMLEAMACAKAVVTTPVGCSGLGLENGRDAFICATWPEFARTVTELLFHPELRSRVGARAREVAERRFSWTAIAEDAYQSYLALAASRRDHDPI